MKPTVFAKLPKTIDIKVISAQQLPKRKEERNSSVVDPYVEIELLSSGEKSVKKRTSSIRSNGMNPIWNEAVQFTLSDASGDGINFMRCVRLI